MLPDRRRTQTELVGGVLASPMELARARDEHESIHRSVDLDVVFREFCRLMCSAVVWLIK